MQIFVNRISVRYNLVIKGSKLESTHFKQDGAVSMLNSNPLKFSSYIGCLNVHVTHGTVYNSTYNTVVFFFVSNLEIVYITTINPSLQFLRQERKSILRHYISRDKII